VLFISFEKPERVHDDHRVGAAVSKWQLTHVAADKTHRRAKVGRNVPRAIQEGGRKVETDDVQSTLRKRDPRDVPWPQATSITWEVDVRLSSLYRPSASSRT
jgi:hypothetical protein